MKREVYVGTFVKTNRYGKAMLSRVTYVDGKEWRDHVWIDKKYVRGYRWGDTLTFTAIEKPYPNNPYKRCLEDIEDVIKTDVNMGLLQKQIDYDKKKFAGRRNNNIFKLFDKIAS